MPVGVDELVSDIARRINADLPGLTAEMTAHFIEVIPEFTHDKDVRQLMVASTSSNLVTIVDMLAHGITPDRVAVPAAAAEYARRFAQRDLSLEALLRAYRLGEHRVVQWSLRYLAELDLDSAHAIATAQRIVLIVNGYIDQIIEGLIDIYESERQRWDRRSDTARAAQLRAVLEADNLDVRDAEEMLGVTLRGWHVAAVAWVDAAVPDAERHLRTAARLLHEAAGREPLSLLADDHTLWAWLSSSRRPAPDLAALASGLSEHPQLRLTVGAPASGLGGFRASHRQALRARTVAETGREPTQLVDFSRVAIAALLSDNLEDLGVWVARTLGELARDDDAMARLRDTVRVFLQCGGSYTDAATRLHLHKNTVHYRVRKAEEALPGPLADNRLDVEVALLVCDQLGRRLIGTDLL
ncbi:MAG TPA: helix-turn-helix domain-containing protein [Pseudonocardia sp.]|nr:helix-turn-helix domain-containing protein [Pseudonocardia sp.]